MKAAVLEKPAATGALDADRLRAIVLVRIACAAARRRPDRARRRPGAASSRIACRPARWRTLLDARDRRACRLPASSTQRAARIEASEAGIGARRHLPRPQGQPAALLGRAARVRLVAKALGLEREPAKRIKALRDAGRPARGHRAARLRPQDQGRRRRPRGCARRWRRWRWSAPSATRSRRGLAGKLGLLGQGRPAAGGAARAGSRAISAPTRACRGAGRRARRRRARPTSARCASRVLRRYLDGDEQAAPQAPRRARQGRRRRGRALVEPAPRRRRPRRPSPAAPTSRASPQEVRRHAARPRAGLARQPQGLHLHVWQSHPRAAPRVGPLARSSSSACWPRRIAPAAWRSPTPT